MWRVLVDWVRTIVIVIGVINYVVHTDQPWTFLQFTDGHVGDYVVVGSKQFMCHSVRSVMPVVISELDPDTFTFDTLGHTSHPTIIIQDPATFLPERHVQLTTNADTPSIHKRAVFAANEIVQGRENDGRKRGSPQRKGG
jgi:hypothetical protein